MTYKDKFYIWAYKGREVIKPLPCMMVCWTAYILMYLFGWCDAYREHLFVGCSALVTLWYGIGKMVRAVIVADKDQVRQAFQREIIWETEMVETRRMLMEYLAPHVKWADECSLTWADGRWIVLIRWFEDVDGEECKEKQVDGWTLFKQLIVTGKLNSTDLCQMDDYRPKVRILNRRYFHKS